jgi:hypothetical protein
VRLFSRGGHDWSAQLPAIVEAMRAFPVTSVTSGPNWRQRGCGVCNNT